MSLELVNSPYYKEMLKRNRLISFFKDDKMKCFITYFIGNGNADKYMKKYSWAVVDDEPETGDTCYVDQIISDHEEKNHKYSRIVWDMLIKHIKENYPQVKKIRWIRVKDTDKLNFCKTICKAQCCNVISVVLKNDRTPEEENDVQLILAHNGTQLKENNGTQYIEIETKCKFLTSDNECSIYDTRFDTCRKYGCDKLNKEMNQCLH